MILYLMIHCDKIAVLFIVHVVSQTPTHIRGRLLRITRNNTIRKKAGLFLPFVIIKEDLF